MDSRQLSRDYVIVGLKRGRHISKAVETINMLRSVFLKDLVVDGVQIGTDKHTNAEGREKSVSTIEIRISNP
jgi:DNA-binding protein Alba